MIDEGLSILAAAERLGIGDGTLGNWVQQARIDAGEKAGITTDEQDRFG